MRAGPAQLCNCVRKHIMPICQARNKLTRTSISLPLTATGNYCTLSDSAGPFQAANREPFGLKLRNLCVSFHSFLSLSAFSISLSLSPTLEQRRPKSYSVSTRRQTISLLGSFNSLLTPLPNWAATRQIYGPRSDICPRRAGPPLHSSTLHCALHWQTPKLYSGIQPIRHVSCWHKETSFQPPSSFRLHAPQWKLGATFLLLILSANT